MPEIRKVRCTKPPKKKTGGQVPRLIVTPDVIEEIERLARLGLSDKQVYSLLKIGKSQWYDEYRKNYPDIDIAMDKGRASGAERAAELLWEKIEAGNFAAIRFYLTSRHGWCETVAASIDENAQKNAVELKITTTDPVEASRIYQQIMMTGS